MGTVKAINSTLQDIDITTDGKIVFENSAARNLLIRESKSKKSHNVELYLKNKSIIKTVEFEPGLMGTIFLDKNSSVDSVKNGIIKTMSDSSK
jgi:hypothetical protein